MDPVQLPADHVLTPLNRLDEDTGALLHRAQTEAEARGHHAARSDLILLVAIARHDRVGDVLRQSLQNATLVRDAIESEGQALGFAHDVPRDAIRKAIFAVVARSDPDKKVAPGPFIAALLRVADSRASRIVRRLGANPSTVAERLDS